MNTTAAAIQANVTVATIRNWCRLGVIAATKTAGRWIIDTASLAHRITIGAMRARKANMLPETDPMNGICAEWYIDVSGAIVIAVRQYSTDGKGDALKTIAEYWRPELPAWKDLDAFDADDCATYLQANGWTLTGAWTQFLEMMTAQVTAS